MKTTILRPVALIFCLMLLSGAGFAAKGKKAPASKESAVEEKLKEPAKKEQPKPAGTSSSELSEKKDRTAPEIKPAETQPTPVQPSPGIVPIQPSQTQFQPPLAAPKAGERIDWEVMSLGGTDGGSASYQLGGSVCQTAVGFGGSASYQLGQGFWQGEGGAPYLCGDANGDQAVTAADVVFLLNYLFRDDDPPDPYGAGDANCDGVVGAADIVYLLNYLFRGGYDPCDTDGNGFPDC
jgi:hypothetical protein